VNWDLRSQGRKRPGFISPFSLAPPVLHCHSLSAKPARRISSSKLCPTDRTDGVKSERESLFFILLGLLSALGEYLLSLLRFRSLACGSGQNLGENLLRLPQSEVHCARAGFCPLRIHLLPRSHADVAVSALVSCSGLFSRNHAQLSCCCRLLISTSHFNSPKDSANTFGYINPFGCRSHVILRQSGMVKFRPTTLMGAARTTNPLWYGYSVKPIYLAYIAFFRS
jgi:hypothetical protein